MKFAHLGDCHLGSWRQPELQQLNLLSFKKAVSTCIEEKVDFVIITGDLFDSAYPPIEILEEAFFEFKRLYNAKISCYLIAGSHDFSASGKTFLSVLEKAGFCKNVFSSEEKQDKIFLNPTLHRDVAIYGYPGKKSGLEVNEIRKIKLQDSPGLFKIFMLHTSIESAVGTLPIDSVRESELPKADYYALGHLHIHFEKDNFVYPGPTFPNNFQEIEELNYGSFCIVQTSPFQIKRHMIKLKQTEFFEVEIKNSLIATESIIKILDGTDLEDKIVLLKVYGKLRTGKTSDIDFKKIEDFVKRKQAFVFLKNISQLKIEEQEEMQIEIEDVDKLEEEIIKNYSEKTEKKQFKDYFSQIFHALSTEKKEGETNTVFLERLMNEINRTFNFDVE